MMQFLTSFIQQRLLSNSKQTMYVALVCLENNSIPYGVHGTTYHPDLQHHSVPVDYRFISQLKFTIANMEKEQRVFLTYRAIFEGTLSQVRQTKAISKVVSQNRKSATTLLKSLGEKEVIPVLKSLLERKVFESEVEAKLAFPNLFTTSLAQDVQHNASEADAARSEAEALEDIIFQGGDRDDVSKNEIDEVSSVLAAGSNPLSPTGVY